MDVVIVESPAKAKTINKYLGSNYKVLASFGHVRDLPPKDGSVDTEHDFEMKWQVDPKSQKRLNEIAAAVKGADRLILATDPDREGEAISWHVMQILEGKKALKDTEVCRVVFNAITKKSVLEAMEAPRQIDTPLVDAYLARRALDYLVGFNLSPVLWRKLPGARSAGRVQSVALRLVCDREAEIESFISQEYWSVVAHLLTPRNDKFEARLTTFDGEKLGRLDIKDGTQSSGIKSMLEQANFHVDTVEAKPTKRHPQAPFTTSTLQQEASRKLGFSASRTMQVAQRLYEGVDIGGETVGLITYMRTDGVQVAPEIIPDLRTLIGSQFGDEFVPEKPRIYSTKAKNAQEAHEAIRPTEASRLPADVAKYVEEDQLRLYELIWKRTVASQMQSATIERTTAEITATHGDQRAQLRATGSVMRFAGFLTLYQEGRDDEEEEAGGRLPELTAHESPAREKIEANQHFTEPPPRYTEATLIKKMEELGIGRPSTYTATLTTLRDREYVELDKKRLIPQDKGRLVTAFLGSFFNKYVEFGFTADLEAKLDQISAGELDWKTVLAEFWRDFSGHINETKDLRVSEVLDALNDILSARVFPDKEDGTNPRICPTCGNGQLSLKLGKFGAFVGCSNYPDCRFTRQLTSANDDEPQSAADAVKELGLDPASELTVTLRSGRFGPYVQLGEEAKPPRASLPKAWLPAEMDLEKALLLLSLPREIGPHPEGGAMIFAGIGRYGPYVNHERTYANIESAEEVFTIGLNRAVTLIAEKAASGGRGRGAAKVLKELGDHPELGGAITVRDGRYGPYVNHGKINATLPKSTDPLTVEPAQALELIAAKAEASGKKPAKKKAATKKKPAAKKTTAKKPAAKKPAAKKSGSSG